MNDPNEPSPQHIIGLLGFFSCFLASKKTEKLTFAKSAFSDEGIIEWSELGFKSLGTLIGPITTPLIVLYVAMTNSEMSTYDRILHSMAAVLVFALIPIHYLLNVADLVGSLLMTLKDAIQENFCSSSHRLE